MATGSQQLDLGQMLALFAAMKSSKLRNQLLLRKMFQGTSTGFAPSLAQGAPQPSAGAAIMAGGGRREDGDDGFAGTPGKSFGEMNLGELASGYRDVRAGIPGYAQAGLTLAGVLGMPGVGLFGGAVRAAQNFLEPRYLEEIRGVLGSQGVPGDLPLSDFPAEDLLFGEFAGKPVEGLSIARRGETTQFDPARDFDAFNTGSEEPGGGTESINEDFDPARDFDDFDDDDGFGGDDDESDDTGGGGTTGD